MDNADKDRLLDAALNHVIFDGWSDATFNAAVEDTGIEPAVAKILFPRAGLDMAVAFHKRGDAEMKTKLLAETLSSMRFRDRVSLAVKLRIEAVAAHKEAVRRGSALFSLPQNTALGAKLIWGTSDAIWTALGDASQDYNWYTKRATLSGVYGSTVLFWLGDSSEDHSATWEFLDRRIENVMQIEKVKAQVRESPVASKLFAGPAWVLSKVRPPMGAGMSDLPGSFGPGSFGK
jgi:ubiquinone biosynthesis protein COQ9